MPTWVSLLRAVNLGARNKVPMARLRDCLTEAGLSDVRTYLQSGNVVSRSQHRGGDAVERVVRETIEREFGLDVPVVVRNPGQVEAAIAANPFPREAAERPHLVRVVFLDATPTPAAVDALSADTEAAAVCQVAGTELYIDYLDGVRGNRFTSAALLRRLGVSGTERNWRTVLALAEMCRDSR